MASSIFFYPELQELWMRYQEDFDPLEQADMEGLLDEFMDWLGEPDMDGYMSEEDY